MRRPSSAGTPPRVHQASAAYRFALYRLVPLWPEDVLDLSREGRARLIAKLERALRAEQQRARTNSHAYDRARHLQLARAYREERSAFERLEVTGLDCFLRDGGASQMDE